MEKVILIHYSEIALKKGNRKYFEQKLNQNILKATNGLPKGNLKIDYGRFVLSLVKDSPVEKIVERLKKIMGIAYFSVAFSGSKDIEVLREQVFEKVQNLEFENFCIQTRRTDKSFPLTSLQVNQAVGEKIHLGLKKPVKIKNPDLKCNIEIYNNQVFFYLKRHEGQRGLPVGSSGRVVSLLSSGIDSPVSSYKMIKRGCRVIFVHFHSFPMTNKSSYHNTVKLAQKLTQYQYNSKIYMVPLIKIQEEIILRAPIKFRIILYRRMMYRIAESIALNEKAKALITGESVGQVASQTLENIAAISEVVSLPILRPLIGYDKEEIINEAKKINTFKTSIEPYDDCCSYLVPENPETKAKPHEVHNAEEKLESWEELIKQAIKESEVLKISFPDSEH
ncbi:tRNA 4-thiouridine(8) synthase ThiI [candidate division KSB1 bacterium 4572_119]|nr:MAG: tRNA 4-thiouridine(8) synthase ThiI [candidate division KSB1 bacterium 4572_119]